MHVEPAIRLVRAEDLAGEPISPELVLVSPEEVAAWARERLAPFVAPVAVAPRPTAPVIASVTAPSLPPAQAVVHAEAARLSFRVSVLLGAVISFGIAFGLLLRDLEHRGPPSRTAVEHSAPPPAAKTRPRHRAEAEHVRRDATSARSRPRTHAQRRTTPAETAPAETAPAETGTTRAETTPAESGTTTRANTSTTRAETRTARTQTAGVKRKEKRVARSHLKRRQPVRVHLSTLSTTGARVPLLYWQRHPQATYYDLQVYRHGIKIFEAWPLEPGVALPRRWQYKGQTYRLAPGSYVWYVWPGFGKKSRALYGKVLQRNILRVG